MYNTIRSWHFLLWHLSVRASRFPHEAEWGSRYPTTVTNLMSSPLGIVLGISSVQHECLKHWAMRAGQSLEKTFRRSRSCIVTVFQANSYREISRLYILYKCIHCTYCAYCTYCIFGLSGSYLVGISLTLSVI